MHMADALLSPAVGTTFWAGTAVAIGYASRSLKKYLDDKMIPLMGVVGAFIFAAQMINFTIPGTGSSGHIGGGMILAILLGGPAAFLVMASVLLVQAFFFADGGLLALGANIWNLGLYPCFIAYPFIYKPLAGDGRSPKRMLLASLLSVVAALQLGAFSVVFQTVLSGHSELPFSTFLLLMQPIHLVIGLVEGFITAGVINYVRSVRPEILESTASSRSGLRLVSIKKTAIAFLVLAIITGGFLSWFASTNPDGLEWSLEKIIGKSELPNDRQGMAEVLKRAQEKTALMPDYDFKAAENDERMSEAASPSWPRVEAGASIAGIIGAVVVLGFIVIIALGIRSVRRRHA